MSEENGRTDSVKKCRARIAIQFLLPWKACEGRIVLSEELVKDRITRNTGSWPLRVELCLWPQVRMLRRREPLLNPFHGVTRLWTNFRLMRRPGTRGLVQDVDGVPLTQEILHPAFAAIGGS